MLAKAALTLVNFAGVATYDNVEGHCVIDKFFRSQQQQHKLRLSPFISCCKFEPQVVE